MVEVMMLFFFSLLKLTSRYLDEPCSGLVAFRCFLFSLDDGTCQLLLRTLAQAAQCNTTIYKHTHIHTHYCQLSGYSHILLLRRL